MGMFYEESETNGINHEVKCPQASAWNEVEG